MNFDHDNMNAGLAWKKNKDVCEKYNFEFKNQIFVQFIKIITRNAFSM